MTVKPLRDYVVIKAIVGPETSSGGIYIAKTVEDKTLRGTVLAVGSGSLMLDGTVVALEVRVGDVVAFHKSVAMEVKENDETFYVIREEQLICVFAPTNA